MCFKLAFLALACLSLNTASASNNKRQVGTAVTKGADHVPAETGFAGESGAIHGGSKYFQYIHVPHKDHYELGHRRGNEHHFTERHEKAHPHAGEFKTKVRWGDKHGGYGEHYWDYNHAGHDHDGDGEESQHNEEYATYEEAESKIPNVEAEKPLRGKREPEKDVEFISDKARSLILDGNSRQKHGGNYRRARDFRGKREDAKINAAELVFDADAGRIIDQKTGKRYTLQPEY